MDGFRFHARYLRVARQDMVYLKFILEAYEGLVVMSTVESEGATVRIGYPETAEADLNGLLQALASDIQMTEIPRPDWYAEGLPEQKIRKAE